MRHIIGQNRKNNTLNLKGKARVVRFPTISLRNRQINSNSDISEYDPFLKFYEIKIRTFGIAHHQL